MPLLCAYMYCFLPRRSLMSAAPANKFLFVVIFPPDNWFTLILTPSPPLSHSMRGISTLPSGFMIVKLSLKNYSKTHQQLTIWTPLTPQRSPTQLWPCSSLKQRLVCYGLYSIQRRETLLRGWRVCWMIRELWWSQNHWPRIEHCPKALICTSEM